MRAAEIGRAARAGDGGISYGMGDCIQGGYMEQAKPGKARLEQALLRLLKQKPLRRITVTELCEAAAVSRSTFYAHYSNVDDIYQELLRRFALDSTSLNTQLEGGSEEDSRPHRPLCSMIRDSEDYAGLVDEERFMQGFLDTCRAEYPEASYGVYRDICSNPDAARALYVFQMTGCIAAAKALGPSCDWDAAKKTIDVFIRGGIQAVKNRG